MKIISFYSILIAACLFSCKQKINVTKQSTDNSKESDTLKVFEFDDTPLFDTLALDNVIDSVTFIPLETNEKSVFNGSEVVVRKINDKYLIVSNNSDRPSAKLFDASGAYVKDLLHLGRGPLELFQLFGFVANDSIGKASFWGYDKIITYDFDTDRLYANNMPKDEYMTFLSNMVSLNDGLYVGHRAGTLKELDENKVPYMYVLDSDFKIKEKKYYTFNRKLFQNMISGVTKGSLEGWVIGQTPSGGVFIDMYSDTVWTIGPDASLTVSYLFNRGQEYMPTIDDVNAKLEVKSQKIFFEQLFENDNYILLSYHHKKMYHTVIWDRINNSMISHSIYSFSYRRNGCGTVLFSFKGFEGLLPVNYITADNRIYVTIPAEKLIGVIPDLKEDDNAVIIEIKLKDNFNSVKQ